MCVVLEIGHGRNCYQKTQMHCRAACNHFNWEYVYGKGNSKEENPPKSNPLRSGSFPHRWLAEAGTEKETEAQSLTSFWNAADHNLTWAEALYSLLPLLSLPRCQIHHPGIPRNHHFNYRSASCCTNTLWTEVLWDRLTVVEQLDVTLWHYQRFFYILLLLGWSRACLKTFLAN